MENKKNNLANEKKHNQNIDMRKEYNEYKKFLISERNKNGPKFLETNAEKKWLENKEPLLKRQPAFNKNEPYYV
tara:strand:+ start:744 stop:965 length:222 start_codon:yes stop_codon:yes gene_type:complete